MARIVLHPDLDRRIANHPGVVRAGEQAADRVKTEAVRITVAEAVDTGLMAASWRVTTNPAPRHWIVRIYNAAQSPEDFPYPYVQEYGWRTLRGRHIPGKHMLARAGQAART